MPAKPPQLAERLLSLFLSSPVRDAILGDLEEQFNAYTAGRSLTFARLWYWAQTLLAIPPQLREISYWSMIMLKSHLKIALRNLSRHKAYTFINISGLAAGVACCLLIFLFVRHETSFDVFHRDVEQIYRVTTEIDWSGGFEQGAGAQFPVAAALLSDYPEVTDACRLFRLSDATVRFGDKQFIEKRFFVADSNFFNFFTFAFVAGNSRTALQTANGVVLTESTARKYFGNANPLGKLLQYENSQTLEVTGVVADLPENCHFHFDFLSSFELYPNLAFLERNWYWNAFWTYVKIPDPRAAHELGAKLPVFVAKYFPEAIRDGVKLPLQRLLDIHLYSHLSNEIEPTGNIVYVYVFSAIAVLVLLIACINFMNLASARSSERALEVGVRKVLGAGRANLIRQFLGENILLSFLAVALAIGIAMAFLPRFNALTGASLELRLFDSTGLLIALLGIALLLGVASGGYPAFVLSRFRPVSVLKRTLGGEGGEGGGLRRVPFRKILVVTQFVISIALMICAGVVYDQLDYIRNKALGFDKEQLLILTAREEIDRQYEAFRNDLLTNSAVANVTRALGTLPGEPTWTFRFVPEGLPREKPRAMHIAYVDYDFISTMGLSLADGRDFSKVFPADEQGAFILNETAARELGWENAAIGKRIEYFGAGSPEIEKTGRVVGVVHDYHFESLHKPIEPLVLTLVGSNSANTLVRIRGGNVQEVLEFMRERWVEYAGDWPFEYAFVDQNLDQRYKQDARVGTVIEYFTILAIVIAALGLLGLAAFAAEKRTREIGVRKVLGASISSIIVLLSSEFMLLIGVSFVVAAPLAYWSMQAWLQNFAYGAGISWTVFVLAGFGSALIAFLTVSSQALRAALTNPVETLRTE